MEVEESRILVTEAQKLERIKEFKDKAVARVFPDSKRAIIKDRLEEMAYIFFSLMCVKLNMLTFLTLFIFILA